MNSREEEEKFNFVQENLAINYGGPAPQVAVESVDENNSGHDEGTKFVDDCTGDYTVAEAVEHFGFGKFQIRLIFSAGVAILSQGVQLLMPVVLGSALECQSWKLSKIAVAWTTTVLFIGMVVFAPINGWIVDKIGRRKGLLVTLSIAPIIAALTALSPSYPYLLASRFLTGVLITGALQVTGFIEEFLPASHRRKAMLTQIFWPLSGIWASGFGLLMIYRYNLSWRWYLLVMSAPLFITAITIFFLPESVRFLGALGKLDKVEKILTNIGKENKTGLPKGKLSRTSLCSSIDDGVELPRATFKDLFSRGNFKTTVPIVISWFISGFMYNGIILLIPLLNSKNGVNSTAECNPLELTDYASLIWTGFAELPGSALAFFSLEYFGRRKTLLIQFAIVGISFVPFFFDLPTTASTILLLIARSACQGSISSLIIYTPELYPTFLRGKGVGVANMLFRMGCVMAPFFSQVLTEHYFNLSICILIGCCFVAVIFVIMLPKETKGVELEN